MITIDPAKISDKESYKLLVGSIVPRPIAFVTTLSQKGVINAAPFSYFAIVSSQPPMLSVSVQRKQGVMKDTARNALDTGAFVVHLVDESIVDAVNQTAASLPPEISELENDGLGLTTIASEVIPVPGVKEAKIRMECVLEQHMPLGGTGTTPSCDLLIGRVVRFHIAPEVMDPDHMYILTDQLQPVSRLAGNDYALLGKQFSLERPQ